jgi:uncharacterized protein (TIGR02466 family)
MAHIPRTSAKSLPPANPQDIQALINLLNSGQLAATETRAKQLIQAHASTFILHHVLALCLDGQQKYAEAADSYQQAIQLQPNNADLYFNRGIALTQIGGLDEAIQCYQQAIRIKPSFFEAHGNIGTILQRLGKLDDAIQSYQNGLKINPQDARGFFNLGTALRDNGDLPAAIQSYQKAIALFPNYTDAYNNLGETYRDQGEMDAAIQQYQAALSRNPNHPNANYNMADFFMLAKRYDEAISHFERSQLDDWQEKRLYCLYKAEQFDAFKANRDALAGGMPNTSPFLATLSTHHSINFNQPDPYNFCKNAVDFVYHANLLAPDSALLNDLLNDIHHANIAERKQGRLNYGQQSAGNLFKRPEASFRALAELVKQAFLDYKRHFSASDCALIQAFPSELEFTSSWYVKMQKGGHLDAHIHEIGWISGAVYLAMPTPTDNPDEGAFEYGTHGDNYPILAPKTVADFPIARILPNVGDIVLFPSSLFHRTIPFNANTERICIAFDLKPAI